MKLLELCSPGKSREIYLTVHGNIETSRPAQETAYTSESIRIVIMRGAFPGKTLVITAGVHGAEYVGIQAVHEFIKNIHPEKLHGSIIAAPLINTSGFYHGAKQIVMEDGENLNRCFPGNKNGTFTRQMAFVLEKYLYPCANFLADLHGGDMNESMAPLVFFPVTAGKSVETCSRAAASILSVKYQVRSAAQNGLYSYAAQCGIPALLIERGGGGRWNRHEVSSCLRNIYELLDFLDILPLSDKNRQQEQVQPPVEICRTCYEEAPQCGFWYTSKCPGDTVSPGECLGQLFDAYGTLITKVTARFCGEVLYLTHTLGVKKGDSLIAYGTTQE